MSGGQVDLEILRRVALVGAKVNQGLDLDDTLQAVVDGVVEALGFGAAALNYVLADGDLQALAVAGPAEAREVLLGSKIGRADMDRLLTQSEAWGELRFVPQERLGRGIDVFWIPKVEGAGEADAWHPDDTLLAALHGSEGELVGVLSVDLPPGNRRPSPLLRELLEIFAVQAGLAISKARLLTQLREEQSRLEASEGAFRFSFAGSTGAMAMLSLTEDSIGCFGQVNDAFCEALRYTRDQLTTLRWTDLVISDERDASTSNLLRVASGTSASDRVERQMVRGDGAIIWGEATYTVIATPGVDASPFVLLHFEDVTERRRKEDSLLHQAQVDPLTGLANRRLLLERLEATLADTAESELTGYLFYGDLDHFKRINDSYGHAVGDLVLKEAAGRLASHCRRGDLVARIGGDEFVILATGLTEPEALELLKRIRDGFAIPMTAVDEMVTISLGLTELGFGVTRNPEVLLQRADQAMYAQKAAQDHA